ncbi:MAG: oligosaccharide flippase family protein [Alphaproteobacteria bacterium]|nr:oligosaccharide flippase family protein [Alphaproteobacteria bacterium]
MSFTRNFIKDSAIYVIPGIISRGVGFLLIPLYTRILTPTDYGVLDLFIIIGSLINLTIALEISQGVARYHVDTENALTKRYYASTGFWFSVLAYSLFCLFAFYFSENLAYLITGSQDYRSTFQLSIFYFALNGLFLFLQNQFRWELKSRHYAVISVLMTCVTALFALIFAYFMDLGLNGILMGMICGSLSASMYGCYKLRTSFGLIFSYNSLRELLAFSLPLVPASICVFISSFIDRMMINTFMNLEDVGIYGVGFRLASVISLILMGFQGAITPLIYKHYKEEKFPQEFANIFRYFIAFSLLCVLGLSIFAKEALIILTVAEYFKASYIVIYLAPAILLSGMYIFSPGIGIRKKTKLILWINVFGAATNALLNYLLIPYLGLQGAALGTLLGNCFVFFLYMLFSQKLYKIPHNWVLLLGITSVTMFLAYIGTHMGTGLYNIIIKVLIMLLVSVFIYSFRIIRKEEIIAGLRLLNKHSSLGAKK